MTSITYAVLFCFVAFAIYQARTQGIVLDDLKAGLAAAYDVTSLYIPIVVAGCLRFGSLFVSALKNSCSFVGSTFLYLWPVIQTPAVRVYLLAKLASIYSIWLIAKLAEPLLVASRIVLTVSFSPVTIPASLLQRYLLSDLYGLISFLYMFFGVAAWLGAVIGILAGSSMLLVHGFVFNKKTYRNSAAQGSAVPFAEVRLPRRYKETLTPIRQSTSEELTDEDGFGGLTRLRYPISPEPENTIGLNNSAEMRFWNKPVEIRGSFDQWKPQHEPLERDTKRTEIDRSLSDGTAQTSSSGYSSEQTELTIPSTNPTRFLYTNPVKQNRVPHTGSKRLPRVDFSCYSDEAVISKGLGLITSPVLRKTSNKERSSNYVDEVSDDFSQ